MRNPLKKKITLPPNNQRVFLSDYQLIPEDYVIALFSAISNGTQGSANILKDGMNFAALNKAVADRLEANVKAAKEARARFNLLMEYAAALHNTPNGFAIQHKWKAENGYSIRQEKDALGGTHLFLQQEKLSKPPASGGSSYYSLLANSWMTIPVPAVI
jgi:hypothetical protein